MVNVKKSNSFFFAACLGVLLPCTNVFSQGVTVETRSAAESQTNVRVQGGGQGVDGESKTRAESSTRTRVRGGGAGVSVESAASADAQTRVKIEDASQAAINNRGKAAEKSNILVSPPSTVEPMPGSSSSTEVARPGQSAQPATQDARASASAAFNASGARPPVNCEKTEEVKIDEMNIKIVNKSCRGKIAGLQAWRENGKTRVQFIFDNKGFSNTTLKMSETWFDRRGHAVNESIDEQKFAIESGRNKTVILSGPIPQAITAVINFYR